MEQLLKELAAIEARAAVQADYSKTIALLRALKAGEVTLDDVQLTDTGWTVGEAEPPPATETTEDADK